MRVYVLLFNARTDNEGIHTLQLGDRNWVLMFEAEDDATRYALLLEAQDFLSPAVEAIDSDEVADFCAAAGYEYKLVPTGFVPETSEDRLLLAPPEHNLIETDWQIDQPGLVNPLEPDEEIEETADPAALADIRRRLEGLL
jgi:hypothetical protein